MGEDRATRFRRRAAAEYVAADAAGDSASRQVHLTLAGLYEQELTRDDTADRPTSHAAGTAHFARATAGRPNARSAL